MTLNIREIRFKGGVLHGTSGLMAGEGYEVVVDQHQQMQRNANVCCILL
eukprot:CAMPEP_0202719118 /NCGR_PEP_ID=MMETSP1385-20130828/128187_1 /ASSEMBLY_ACC=CAM_ASM_000861 /TAXON_ID=933848 /ORGANISM="Elphidium margaritaceum" /LENGTH=48 /DNA_ID= /DNA_START= /DNA_END= /DNA_ORIENTATION=